MKKLILTILALFSFSLNAEDVIIKSLETKPGAVVIKMSADINSNPNLTIKEKSIEVIIPNAHVNAKIEKKINQITLTATQIDRDTVKVTATMPVTLQGKEEQVNIMLRENAIQINVPKFAFKETAKPAKISRSPGMVEPAIAATEKAIEKATEKIDEKLDESYLNKLENEQAKREEKPTTKTIVEAKKNTQVDTDRVSVTQAGVAKMPAETPKSSFSIATYVGKFVAFLSLMILGFYGVLTLFKKGVIKKGRLGFLNSTKLVEVLSTTHVAPKRSLMMIKAHKQVFLISNSETGMQLISEIQDVTGLIKNGEQEITGTNFDTNMVEATRSEKEFKLKEEVEYSSLDEMLNDAPAAAKSIAKAPIKDEVRFSDQIKSKIKNLKQLQ
jgi:flagellar biogenesis protein FliO